MRTLAARIVVFISIVLAVHQDAYGWDNEVTHPEITEVAAIRSRDALSVALERFYGLPEGTRTRLGIRDDISPLALRAELRLDRFETTHRIGQFGPDAPPEVAVELDSPCPEGADFEACFASRRRYPIEHLLRSGVYGEDNPNIRAAHHFHDPAKTHGNPRALSAPVALPADNRGQDNTTVVSQLYFDELLAYFATNLFRGGGDFGLFGRSAQDRALGIRNGNSGPPPNLFDLPWAERYLARSVSAPTLELREHYMALHFLSIGSVLHLLEDMSSPAHTRNDFLVDHIGGYFTGLEEMGKKTGAIELLEGLREAGGSLLVSRPAQHLLQVDGGRFAGQFDTALPIVSKSAIGTADFWDRHQDDAPLDQMGLAEIVNRRFFSEGTVSDTLPAQRLLSYPHPSVPSCEAPGSSEGAAGEVVTTRQLPRRTLLDGSANTTYPSEPLFLSSRLVPHLARCRFHAYVMDGQTIGRTFYWIATTIDESVQRDYLELLFPLGIDFTEGFLRHYFAPRLEVRPFRSNQFELANVAVHEFEASASELRFIYTNVEGGISSLAFDCGLTDSTFVLQPGESLHCTMPATISPGQLPPRDRYAFTLLVRGRLGNRGAVITESDLDTDVDFVTAVHRVLGARIAMEVGKEQLRDSTSQVIPLGRDDRILRDVYLFAFGLPETGHGIEGPQSWLANLTAEYRPELPPSIEGLVDFSAPSAEPGGSRIAFSSDLRIESGIVGNPNQGDDDVIRTVSDIHVMDVFDPTTIETIADVAGGNVPACDFDCPPSWDQAVGSETIVFSTGTPGPVFFSPEAFVRVDVGSTPAEIQFPRRNLSITSVRGDRMVGWVALDNNGSTADAIYVANSTTGVATHLIDLTTTFEVVACQDHVDPSVCDVIPVPGSWEGADPQLSPDGTKVAFSAFQALPTNASNRHYGALLVADLAAGGAVTQLTGAGFQVEYPVWSPDGEWIAYVQEDDGHVYVIPSTGGEPIRVSRDPVGGSNLTWMHSLALP